MMCYSSSDGLRQIINANNGILKQNETAHYRDFNWKHIW